MPKHAISLPPDVEYDIVGSIVLYRTDPQELQHAIEMFLHIPLNTHLCIIDNSPEPTRIECDSRQVSYHFLDENLGYGSAHNLALRAAKGRARYNLVMNTDIEYAPSVVCVLKGVLDERPSAGLAAPRICYPDGSLQFVCRLLPTPRNLFLRRFAPNSRLAQEADFDYELRWWEHDEIASIPYFQGSFMLLRTELYDKVGIFDERFFMYGEDIDLTRRFHEVSETLYVPSTQITHQYRRFSSRSLKGTWIGIVNNCRYFNKWGWFFDRKRDLINKRVVQSLHRVPSPTFETQQQEP